MPGMFDFVKMKFQPRSVISKSAAYTLLVTDEQVIMTGSSPLTFTLPGMDAIAQQVVENKLFLITNNGTALLTISPGTNGVTSSAQTIAGRPQWVLNPGESVVVFSLMNKADWQVQIFPVPAELRNVVTLVVTTNGTTPVNVVDAGGNPVVGTILAVDVIAQDTTAGNITVVNGVTTVVTIAKGTTAGLVTGDSGGLSSPSVPAGAIFTVASSSAGNAKVRIQMSLQNLA